jgi:hypothetical protein
MILWFMRRPYPIFALLWLSPLWRGLGLLNKLEFQSCKKCWYQVWLKLGRCFFLKDSFQYTNVKKVSLLLSPTLTLGDNNLYKIKSALSQKSFHVNMSYSGSVVLKEKLFSMTSPNFCIFVIISPLKRTCPFISTI